MALTDRQMGTASLDLSLLEDQSRLTLQTALTADVNERWWQPRTEARYAAGG